MKSAHHLNIQQLLRLQVLLAKLKRKATAEIAAGLDEALLIVENLIKEHRQDLETQRLHYVAESTKFEDIQEVLKTLEKFNTMEIEQCDSELKFYR